MLGFAVPGWGNLDLIVKLARSRLSGDPTEVARQLGAEKLLVNTSPIPGADQEARTRWV